MSCTCTYNFVSSFVEQAFPPAPRNKKLLLSGDHNKSLQAKQRGLNREERARACLEVERDLAGQVTLAVSGHHLLPHVVQLDVLDVPPVLVVFYRFVHGLVRLDPLLEVLK